MVTHDYYIFLCVFKDQHSFRPQGLSFKCQKTRFPTGTISLALACTAFHLLLTSDACSGISQETAHPETLNRGNLHSYLLRAEEKRWGGDM